MQLIHAPHQYEVGGRHRLGQVVDAPTADVKRRRLPREQRLMRGLFSHDSRPNRARHQAEIPLSALCNFRKHFFMLTYNSSRIDRDCGLISKRKMLRRERF
jgi:hypothetical protein